MAFEDLGKTISRPAAADHSSNQFKFMKINSSSQAALCSVLGERIAGVLQDKPSAAGQAGSLMVGAGVTKITLGATLSAGDSVTTSAAGVAVATASGHYQAGILLEGGVSGNIVAMLLTPGGFANIDAAAARTVTLVAAADYSSTGQYLCVEVDSAGKWATQVVAGGVVNGVLQNAPAAGADGIAAVDGVCTVKLGETVAAGAQVQAEVTTARAVAAAVDGYPIGTLLAGGDDGDDVLMLLQIGAMSHTHT